VPAALAFKTSHRFPTTPTKDAMAPPKPRKKQSYKKLARKRLLSGLLVIVPAGLTVYILSFLYDLTAGRLAPAMRPFFGTLPNSIVTTLALLVLLLVTYGVGLVASAVAGRTLIGLAEAVLDRIPLVKTVYGASKQLVHTLSLGDDTTKFRSVVLVDFPRPGMKALGFVTGTIRLREGESGPPRDYYRVFVTTTPNPTSGYLEFVPVEEAEPAGISVEDALKALISGGLVMPETLGGGVGGGGVL